MDVRGGPLSFRERWAVGRPRSEGPVSAAVDIGMTAFNVRVRLRAVFQSRRLTVAFGPIAEVNLQPTEASKASGALHNQNLPPLV
ncbi:hypothetical protein D3C71_1876290 [compost metagenome]